MVEKQLKASVIKKTGNLYLQLGSLNEYVGMYAGIHADGSQIKVTLTGLKPDKGVAPKVNPDGILRISVKDFSLPMKRVYCKPIVASVCSIDSCITIEHQELVRDRPLVLPEIKTVTSATKEALGFPVNSDFAEYINCAIPPKLRTIHKTSRHDIPYDVDIQVKKDLLLHHFCGKGIPAIREYIAVMAPVTNVMSKINWPAYLMWDPVKNDFVVGGLNHKLNDARVAPYCHAVVINSPNGDDAVDSHGNRIELKMILVDHQKVGVGQEGQLTYGDGNLLDVLHLNYREYANTDLSAFNKLTFAVLLDSHTGVVIDGFVMSGNSIVSIIENDSFKKLSNEKKLYPERHVTLRQILKHGFRFSSMVPCIGFELWAHTTRDYHVALRSDSSMTMLERQLSFQNFNSMQAGVFLQSL